MIRELKELKEALRKLDFKRINALIDELSQKEPEISRDNAQELRELLEEVKIYLNTTREVSREVLSSLSGEILREGHGSCFLNLRV